MIRHMKIEDYDGVYSLWKTIKGFGMRSVDDSKENIDRFLKRNPNTSFIAEQDGKIVGSLLCGHDGRTGCFYHVCVEEGYRNRGIASRLVELAVDTLKKEGISKVTLVAFVRNQLGNDFWRKRGWNYRKDFNYYDLVINQDNQITFND